MATHPKLPPKKNYQEELNQSLQVLTKSKVAKDIPTNIHNVNELEINEDSEGSVI